MVVGIIKLSSNLSKKCFDLRSLDKVLVDKKNLTTKEINKKKNC